MALHLNKLESASPKDFLSQVWLKLALWVWRRTFLNFLMYFCYFLYLYKFEFHLLKDALCFVFGWNWLCGSGEEDENVKRQQQTKTNFDQKSSRALSYKKIYERPIGYIIPGIEAKFLLSGAGIYHSPYTHTWWTLVLGFAVTGESLGGWETDPTGQWSGRTSCEFSEWFCKCRKWERNM